jgi:complement component 1 Q subcomponent-binding protein
VSRLTSSTIRRPISRAFFLQTASKPANPQFAAAFSTSVARKEKEGEVDEELVAKFESELELEAEVSDQGVSPAIKEYLENGPFEIEDIPGQEDVVLTRKFGDEK